MMLLENVMLEYINRKQSIDKMYLVDVTNGLNLISFVKKILIQKGNKYCFSRKDYSQLVAIL